jgi:hypothetical protein
VTADEKIEFAPDLPKPEAPEHALGEVPMFPTDALPAAARALVRSGEKGGLPATLLGGAALGALAAAVGSGSELEVTPSWHERAILWIVLLAPAGAGKSPSQGLALAPLEDYDEQLGEGGPPVLLGDLTMEALARSFNDSGGTATLAPDELAVLLRGLGEYKRAGGGDRGRFLGLWSGRPWTYTRVGSGGKPHNQIDLRLHRPTLCIVGGLQTRLHELLGSEEDGSRPRWLPHLATMPDVDLLRSDTRHPMEWQTLLGRDLLPQRNQERVWRLDSSARAAFDRHRTAWKQQARDAAPALGAALVKADVHLARVALALAEADHPGRGGMVEADTVERAATLVRFVLDCWRAIPEQDSLGLSWRDRKLDTGVERLAEWLEGRPDGEANRRELQRAHVAGARTGSDLDALLERYEDTYPGLVTEVRPERGGLPTTVVRAPTRRPPTPPVSPLATVGVPAAQSPRSDGARTTVAAGDTASGDTARGDTACGVGESEDD